MENVIKIGRRGDKCVTNVPHTWVHHSPDGFEYGYGGSGPSDLALNVLLLFTDKDTAWKLHQDFKWKFIATLKQENSYEIPHETGMD